MARPLLHRRQWLAGAAAACAALPSFAQKPPGRPIAIAQLHDVSASEQDVSRDFLVGSRAAWQEINGAGGVRGRPVQHVTIDVDGTAASLERAWQAVRQMPSCVALSGTSGDPLAARLGALLRGDGEAIAHAAPWLQNASAEIDDRTFPIFAARQEQIAHALKSLRVSGMKDVGAVFASAREADRFAPDVTRAAEALELSVSRWTASGPLVELGQRLGPATPAVLLFVGGTPELIQFTQGLERQARQRYVVALADVNLQTVAQLRTGRATPIIATQAVPLTTAASPIVRRYREALARLFDEPPSALSLAGYIAASFTAEVLSDVDGPPTRASVLAAFQRRRAMDLGGFRIGFDAQRRSATFVTQSMLTADGRVVG